jgi:hypothetical protein
MRFLLDPLRIVARVTLWVPTRLGIVWGVIFILAGWMMVALREAGNSDVPIGLGMILFGGVLVSLCRRLNRALMPDPRS